MRYVWNGDAWVKTLAHRESAAPAVISDHMDPLLHPVTGEILDSKSQFRARTRENNCLELGNDAAVATKPPARDRNQIKRDIYDAISQLEQGRHAPVIMTPAGVVRRYG